MSPAGSRFGRDALVAAASILVIAVSVAAGPGGPLPLFGGGPPEPPRVADAWLDGPLLTLAYDAPIAGQRLPTPEEILVRVNGGAPLPVENVTVDVARQEVVVRLAGGAASLDEATLEIIPGIAADGAADGALEALSEGALRVATPPWSLPDTRRNAGVAATPDALYVFGGYRMTPEPAGPTFAPVLDVIRIDVATGAARTQSQPANARPIAWDPRATEGCPEGCIRMLVYGDPNATTSAFGRFDPTTETLVVESSPLPRMPNVPALAWTGSVAYAFFPYGPASTWRYDPVTGELAQMRGHIPDAYNFTTLQATWDPRPSLVCPAGCAYILGGWGSALAPPGTSGSPRDEIWRYDPVLDVVVPMRASLPERFNAVPVWIDDAAYQFFVPIGFGAETGPIRVSRYDPVADESSVVAEIDAARDLHAPVWLGDRGWLVGGHGTPDAHRLIPFQIPGR